MPLIVRFLGTSASRPTVERGVSSLAIIREGETLLFDCGEGTQRQMMRYGISFSLADIFFTHFHTDHFLGVIGLMRTMALQGRTESLRLWGPKGAARFLRQAEQIGSDRLTFPLVVQELAAGSVITRKQFRIAAFEQDHRGSHSLGYALIEDQRRGRFNVELAKSLGIPEGPLWGRIHKGESVTLDDGRVVESAQLVGPARRGRRIVLTGDTRPHPATVEIARNADLLIHEATFGEEEAARAVETGHSTAREAAEIAARSGVRRLILTHLSARYTRDFQELEQEARGVFAGTIVARDGMEVDVDFADD